MEEHAVPRREMKPQLPVYLYVEDADDVMLFMPGKYDGVRYAWNMKSPANASISVVVI